MNLLRMVLVGLVVLAAGLLTVLTVLFASGRPGAASPGVSPWAENASYTTTCAEEDNINVPIFAPGAEGFRITASHPTYEVGVDNCAPDFSGCDFGDAATAVQAADTCTQPWNDGTNVVEVCVVPDWWRPYNMDVTVGDQAASGHYLRLYRKIVGEDSWPQFLVLYQDGNMRLKPHPPEGRPDVCFGSSAIIGAAAPATRPYVDIQKVSVNIEALSLEITYRNGGVARLSLSVDRINAVVDVEVGYETTDNPIATFRSMWVSDGNSDVDHVQTGEGEFTILSSWTSLAGPSWLFHRQFRSSHNTSAPDILIEVDSDGDGLGDSSDPDDDNDSLGLPPGDDPPGGFFRDSVEAFIGTDPLDECADTSDANDETGAGISPWPPDFNDNGLVDIGDLVALRNHWVPLGETYGVRYDLNANGICGIGDLVVLRYYWVGSGYDTCSVG
jgi:hypothetical protein